MSVEKLQCPGRRHTECRHCLAENVFPEDGAKTGPTVAHARKGRTTGALEQNVETHAVSVDQFAEEDRSPISQLRNPAAKLVPGISHGKGVGAFWDPVS